MNWAIGQGSMGGRCERSRGKCRMSSLTSSLLHSQNPFNNSRSSSGVSRSEEKISGDETTTDSSRATGRFLRWVFIAFLPTLKLFSGQRSHGQVAASKCPRLAANRTKRLDERGKKATSAPPANLHPSHYCGDSPNPAQRRSTNDKNPPTAFLNREKAGRPKKPLLTPLSS